MPSRDESTMIGLEWEMTYRLRSVGPMETTVGSPWGAKQYWQMSDAELDGPRIRAHAPYVGGDWMNVGPDGLGRPNVRVQFCTDDGETVLLRYTGLVEATAAFNHAAETNGTTDFSDQMMRMTMTFETGAERYEWLNRSLFIAEGRLNSGMVEYAVYRVV
jgi:hypothetical protein